MNISVEDWCLFLPGSSTLRSSLPHIDPYKGITEEMIEVFSKHATTASTNSFGIAFDEMEIRDGILYRKSDGRIIGLAEGMHPEHNVDSLDPQSINDSLATHVMQF